MYSKEPVFAAIQNDPSVNVQGLESWANKVLSRQYPINEAEISKIGLQNTSDVLRFLNSHEGVKLRAAINREYNTELDQLENLIEQGMELLQKRQRLQALFMLKTLARQEAMSNRNKEFNEQLDKEEDKENQTSVSTTKPTVPPMHPDLLNGLANDYMKVIEQAKEQLHQNETEEKELTEFRDLLLKEADQFEARFNLFDNAIQEFEDAISKMHSEGPVGDEVIELEIARLEKEMESITASIVDDILANNEDEAMMKMSQHTCLWLQHAAFSSMKDKDFYDELGQPTTYDNAYYALDKNLEQEHGLKLVEKDGQLYLLEPGKDVNDLDQEALKNAKNNFIEKKHSVMSVKAVVNANKQAEQADHASRLDEVENRLASNKKQKALLTAQLTLAETGFNKINQMKPKPAVKPEAKPAAPTPEFTIGARKQLTEISNTMQEFCDNRQAMPMATYQNRTKNYYNNVKTYLNTQLGVADRPSATSDAEKRFRPTSSISTQKMQAFLRTVPLLGINTYKPGIVPIPGQLIQQSASYQNNSSLGKQQLNAEKKAGTLDREDEEKYSKAPSPFDTTPNPFKKK